MAQQGGRRKQAPTYSADTMALRYIAGLALAALGVMIFMAVDLRMSGNIFQGLRQVSFGLSGSMAYLLAVLPLWAGGLVIWSTQRRAPVRPWIFALLSFAGICAFIMLISGNAMELLDQRAAGNYGTVIRNSYSDCEKTGTGGGAIGAMLAWPLWKPLGQVLGTVIYFLLIAFFLLMMVDLTPMRIRDLITGQAGERRRQQEEERRQAEQQQMAWQQQQAMQQAAWQQQQAYILEQQQQQYRQQQMPQQAVLPQTVNPRKTKSLRKRANLKTVNPPGMKTLKREANPKKRIRTLKSLKKKQTRVWKMRTKIPKKILKTLKKTKQKKNPHRNMSMNGMTKAT